MKNLRVRIREELAAIIGALEIVVGIYTALQWDNYGLSLKTILVTLFFVVYSYAVYKLCFQVYKDIVKGNR